MKNRTTLTINKISQRFGAQRHRMMRCALQQIIVQSLHFQAKQNGILSKNPPLGKPLPPTKYFPLSPRIVARATITVRYQRYSGSRHSEPEVKARDKQKWV